MTSQEVYVLLNQCIVATALVFFSSLLIRAATFTVAKDGSGNFTSIQEAVNAAGADDEIVILDTEVY